MRTSLSKAKGNQHVFFFEARSKQTECMSVGCDHHLETSSHLLEVKYPSGSSPAGSGMLSLLYTSETLGSHLDLKKARPLGFSPYFS